MKFKCKEGWLLSKSSTDGSLVPFFIHVLSKHIHHNLNDDFDARIFNVVSTSNIESINYAISRIKYTSGDWGVSIDSDNRYEIVRELPLSSPMFSTSSDGKSLVAQLALPIQTSNDKYFSVSAMINTDHEEIFGCEEFISIQRTTDKIPLIKLRLYNTSGTFPTDRSSSVYTESSIHVTVKGNIKF